MTTAGRTLLRAVEYCAYVAGGLAAIVLAWQVAALALAITVGPGAPHLAFPLDDQLKVFGIALCSLPAIVGTTVRLRDKRGRFDWSLPLQLGIGLLALALSYRFAALLAFLGAVVCHMTATEARRAAAWWIWGTALLLCLSPIDVSLRSAVTSPRPRLVATMNCEAATRQTLERNNTGELVCVAEGASLYSEPRSVLVW